MLRLLPLLSLLTACGPAPDLDAAPSWALNWASVTPTESGIEGYQVWQFFVDGWEAQHSDDYYKCKLTQDLTGHVTACPLTGVPTCYAAYEVELAVYENECAEALARDESYDGPPWMAIGAPAPELAADAPEYGDFVLGWYIGYPDGTRLAHGYAYARRLEDGEEPAGVGWLNDEEYILWPAYVWELGENG
ncbi:MAG: hypothetical protein ABIO70_19935 [Pseudomonadota bacterium]